MSVYSILQHIYDINFKIDLIISNYIFEEKNYTNTLRRPGMYPKKYKPMFCFFKLKRIRITAFLHSEKDYEKIMILKIKCMNRTSQNLYQSSKNLWGYALQKTDLISRK